MTRKPVSKMKRKRQRAVFANLRATGRYDPRRARRSRRTSRRIAMRKNWNKDSGVNEDNGELYELAKYEEVPIDSIDEGDIIKVKIAEWLAKKELPPSYREVGRARIAKVEAETDKALLLNLASEEIDKGYWIPKSQIEYAGKPSKWTTPSKIKKSFKWKGEEYYGPHTDEETSKELYKDVLKEYRQNDDFTWEEAHTLLDRLGTPEGRKFKEETGEQEKDEFTKLLES